MTATRHLLEYETPRQFLDVEAYEGAVELVVEIPPGEFLPRELPPRPQFDRFLTLEAVSKAADGYADELAALLKRVREAGQITRHLEPAEARAIAASLVHYAGELEAGRA